MIKPLHLLALFVLAATCWQCTAEAKPDDASSTLEAGANKQAAAATLRTFATTQATPQDYQANIPITGRINALEQIPIIAEVQGQVEAGTKLLQEGVRYRKGETLVRIEDKQYRLGLQAQRSQFQSSLVRIMSQIQLDYPDAHGAWDEYLRNFKADQTLAALPEVTDDQLRYFLAAQGVFTTYYNIKSAEELLPKYRIKAPFNGIIAEGSISAGTVVSPGAQLARFSRTDIYEFKASLSASDIDKVRLGQQLQLRQPTNGKTYIGKVHRIGGTVDPGTQAVPVFVRVSGAGLRDGMFLETGMATEALSQVVAVPKDALTRDDQVHVIVDSTVILHKVQPVRYSEDVIWVTGLETGMEVITEQLTEPIVGLRALPKK
ncbi:MAG: efflux RND transporter periplasmic adaptor subunit [Bacteroidota bacterium]